MSTRRKQSRPNRHPDDDTDDTDGQPSVAVTMSTAGENEGVQDAPLLQPSEPLGMRDIKRLPEGEEDHMISEDEEEEDEDDEMSPEEQGNDASQFEPDPSSRFNNNDPDDNPLEDLQESPIKFDSREGSAEKDSDESPELEKESLTAALQNLMVDFHWPEGTSITIERVESTKVAVAELTAAAIQSSTTDYSSASLQDLALIQSTLFTLQQQQIVQLQLIQQLLAQLAMCTGEVDSAQESERGSPGPTGVGDELGTPRRPKTDEDKICATLALSSPTPPHKSGGSNGEALSTKFASMLNCGNQDPNRPLSPGLTTPFNFNSIMMPDGGSSEEVNTLEMLQKRAQEVLDSASQGLLASSLVDDSYKKQGVMDKREPFFKHRCRYCGKVFGSDSALQIHIRSHTGERPYKCNVCGSRFTTKGNLKVHFQRHASKFPHVKMNPHPIPEHMDHFHPPILASGERSPELIPSNLPFGPVPPFQPVNFMRFDNQAAAAAAAAAAKLSLGLQLQEALEPEDLSKAKPKIRKARDEDEELPLPPRAEKTRRSDEDKDSADEREQVQDDEIENDEDSRDVEMADERKDQPENLSSKSLPLMHSLPLQATPRPTRPSSTSKVGKRRGSQSPSTKELEKMEDLGLLDITKDPRSYAALLPRPGSASSAWETLIEVNTSSETSKLQQLVDNIDNQISDPNECVVCHRVLSCKSALQMHYRTHTGERPFKCRLCGRAFTTKGNLKTHMGVHRIKEGDTHHQCPVCHKRFTTQLVLQQHIRLHTGEPTELTFDQIRAGEIRDFIPNFPPTSAGLPSFHAQKTESSRDAPPTPAGNHSTPGGALFPEDLSKKVGSGPSTPSILHTGAPPSTTSRNSAVSPATTDSELSSSDWTKHSESDFRATPPTASNVPSGAPFLPLDLTPKNNIFSPFLPNLNHPLMGNSALSSLANSVLNSTAAFNPVHMSVIAGRGGDDFVRMNKRINFVGATRGNTTCGLCLKTFACNSALEIHYRSHTKERPFKCTVCDRGFSTKGNMKQHMLTHKIRDMPPNVFDGSKIQNQNSNSSCSSSAVPSTQSTKPTDVDPDSSKESIITPTEKPKRELENQSESSRGRKAHEQPSPEEQPRTSTNNNGSSNNNSSAADEDSRSSSGGSKHMCHVCQKGFSSSSSLHIHMRTHTGDKPFKCSVCQKAFTTKGNLKVHMGTHMWTSGASRRGRRMSLELPLGLPFQPHPGDRVDGRSFFPFVPPNFPGGPINLAASKFCDYSLLRPPMQFPPGMLAGNPPGSSSTSTAPKDDDEDNSGDAKDEDDE